MGNSGARSKLKSKPKSDNKSESGSQYDVAKDTTGLISGKASKGAAKGKKWTYELWFDSEADTEVNVEYIPYEQLLSKVEGSACLRTVFVYEAQGAPPASSWWRRLRKKARKHFFIVMEDELGQYWSIEKDNESITIQRSNHNSDAVVEFCRCTKRSDTMKLVERTVKGTGISVNRVIESVQTNHHSLTYGSMSCYEFIAWVCECHSIEIDSLSDTIPCLRTSRGRHLPVACTGGQHEAQYIIRGIPEPSEVCCKEGRHNDGQHTARYIIDANPCMKARITDMVSKVNDTYGANEPIISATAYKAPTSEKQLEHQTIYHLFIVLETEHWYWSIEKDYKGLTIQRSKYIKSVRDRYRQLPRPSGRWCKVQAKQAGKGTKTIKELITWLETEEWLDRKYKLFSSNCKHFGKAVYKYVTNKNESPIDLSSINLCVKS